MATQALRWGVPMLGVATADEALLLRNSEETKHAAILLMGPSFSESAEQLIAENIELSVGSMGLLQACIKASKKLAVVPKLHLKCETGMGRYGFQPCDLPYVVDLLSAAKISPKAIMTHYAVSDEFELEDHRFTESQATILRQSQAQIQKTFPKLLAHACNSGAVLMHADKAFDFQRPGMMLYGAHPNPAEANLSMLKMLHPVLTLQTQIISTHTHEAGTSISYGRTFTFAEKGKTAILPIGYGDGFPRTLSNNADVLIRGKRFPVIGRICMDQTMVDISAQPELPIGEPCVLIGRQGAEEIRLEEIAQRANTIPYEITCQIGRRIPRRYINSLACINESGGA